MRSIGVFVVAQVLLLHPLGGESRHAGVHGARLRARDAQPLRAAAFVDDLHEHRRIAGLLQRGRRRAPRHLHARLRIDVHHKQHTGIEQFLQPGRIAGATGLRQIACADPLATVRRESRAPRPPAECSPRAAGPRRSPAPAFLTLRDDSRIGSATAARAAQLSNTAHRIATERTRADETRTFMRAILGTDGDASSTNQDPFRRSAAGSGIRS